MGDWFPFSISFGFSVLLRGWRKGLACWWLPVSLALLLLFTFAGRAETAIVALGLVLFVLLAGYSSRHPHRVIREGGTFLGALSAAMAGLQVETVKMPFTTHFVSLGIFSLPLTAIWLWLFAALFRPTARLKGLTWSVSALSGLTFALIVWMNRQSDPERALTMAFMVIGFGLAFWGLPAEAGGAAAMGALLGAASVAGALKNTAFLILVAPALALGVPMLEVTYRLRSGGFLLPIRRQSLFDLLTEEGVDEARAFWLLTFLHAYLCALVLLLVRLVVIHFTVKLILMVIWFFVGAVAFWVALRLSARRERKGVVNFLGVPVAAMTMDEVLDIIEGFIAERHPRLIITPDTSAIIRAREDKEFQGIVQKADLVTPDGIGVVWGARLLGLPIYERVPGVELMAKLCERAARKGWTIFLLGAKPGIAEKAAENLQRRYPGLRVVGTYHGYFSAQETPQVLDRIKTAKPDILFVAMGIPKQEKWIASHAEELGVPVCLGVGGSFDVYAGVVRRAPRWVQQLGLEWLYRTVKEPRRLPRLIAIPKFFWLVTKEILKGLRRR